MSNNINSFDCRGIIICLLLLIVDNEEQWSDD